MYKLQGYHPSVEQILFHEPEYYFLDNFSSFKVRVFNRVFDTAEHAYQWRKFDPADPISLMIINAPSAHEAARLGRHYKSERKANWHADRWMEMMVITREKLFQHEIIQHKLLEKRWAVLVENSSTDSYWGGGADGKGQNHMGRLWMMHRDILVQWRQDHTTAKPFREYYTDLLPSLWSMFCTLRDELILQNVGPSTPVAEKFQLLPMDHQAYPDSLMALDQLNHAHATGNYDFLRRTHGPTIGTPVAADPTDDHGSDDRDYHDHPEL